PWLGESQGTNGRSSGPRAQSRIPAPRVSLTLLVPTLTLLPRSWTEVVVLQPAETDTRRGRLPCEQPLNPRDVGESVESLHDFDRPRLARRPKPRRSMMSGLH